MVGLDILRLLAITFVIGRHMDGAPASWPAAGRRIMEGWQRGGWVGVDLFFVLSGFLVSGLLFANYKSRADLSIKRFYMRRAWKIYPPFFVMIAATIAVGVIVHNPVQTRHIIPEILFVQNYFVSQWGYTWSLAIEEHFYALLPLVLALVLKLNGKSRDPFRPVLAIGVFLMIAELTLRIVHARSAPEYSHLTHLFPTHLRIDALFFGVAVSYLYHFHDIAFHTFFARRRLFLIAGGAALLVPAFVFQLETTPFIYTAGLSLFTVGAAMLTVGVLLCHPPRTALLRFLGKLGAYSYSIYLWHGPMKIWGLHTIQRLIGSPLGYGAENLLFFVGSLTLGVIMAKSVEIPVLRLRNQLFPRQSSGPLEPQTAS